MDGLVVQKQTRGVRLRVMVLVLALAAIIPSIIFRRILMLMYVPSESMYPTMTAGDILIGVRNASSFERGDVVAFQAEPVMIKRIVGLPEECVTIDEKGTVFINGSLLEEPYVENPRAGKPQTFHVPEGCVLLFGDNRTDSFDARFWENPYTETGALLAVAKNKLFGGELD